MKKTLRVFVTIVSALVGKGENCCKAIFRNLGFSVNSFSAFVRDVEALEKLLGRVLSVGEACHAFLGAFERHNDQNKGTWPKKAT